MSKPLTLAERQKILWDKRKAAGFVRVCEWVHHEQAEIIKAAARQMRIDYFKRQGGDGK